MRRNYFGTDQSAETLESVIHGEPRLADGRFAAVFWGRHSVP
jgi:hypothetical protein